MLMTVNCLILFLLRISHKMFHTWKLLSSLISTWMLAKLLSPNQSTTELLLTLPNSLLKSLILLFFCYRMQRLLYLTRLVISVSHWTLHSLCRIIFPLYLNLAFCLFVTFVELEILSIQLQLKLSLHISFIPS